MQADRESCESHTAGLDGPALEQLFAEQGLRSHQRLQKAQEDALRSQIGDLREQLAEYEALRAQTRSMLAVESFEEFPRALVQARIAAGISQKELAERLGIKEQQIQRYEATDYAAASMTKVAAVIQALGITVREEIILPRAESSTQKAAEGPG